MGDMQDAKCDLSTLNFFSWKMTYIFRRGCNFETKKGTETGSNFDPKVGAPN